MAKKKVTVTEEEIVEDPKEEKQIDYKEDIKDKSMKDIASEEQNKDEKDSKAEVAAVPDEKVEPSKEPEPEINLEENNRKIAEEASQKTRDAIADLIKGDSKEETKTNKDEYREWAEDYAKKTGKSPEYTDAFEFLEDRALRRLEEKQAAKLKEAEETKQKQTEQEKVYEKQLNDMIDEELTELYSSNKLTKIKNAEDPNDLGVRERKALLQTMYDVNVARANEGKPPIYSVARIHSNYYKPVNKQPAGADAMILNNRAGSAPADENDYDYVKDIKGRGWKSFFKR